MAPCGPQAMSKLLSLTLQDLAGLCHPPLQTAHPLGLQPHLPVSGTAKAVPWSIFAQEHRPSSYISNIVRVGGFSYAKFHVGAFTDPSSLNPKKLREAE